MPLPHALLLNGFMGAGKTTVGAVVARRAGVPFVDLDVAIAARAELSIPEIFRQRGEAGFRALEAAALDELVAADGARVISLGGGALLERSRRLRMLERAFVVTLEASAETLAARLVHARASRPLLAGGDLASRIELLLGPRAAGYAECHARVGTDDEPPEVVADRVLAAWSAERVAVPLGARTYTARFEDGASGAALAAAAAELAPTSIVLVTDSNVAPLWAAPAEAALARVARTARVVLPAGEAHKRLGTVEAALAEMLAAGADRRSVVVSLGGGVASDMAGFAAAVFLRGVRWVCAPTTLLAMVDASVGGKTGVDLGDAKNAVGAFHQPSAVVVDAAYTATQAARDYTSGLAEVVKTACVGDAALLDRLEAEVDALRARRLDVVRGVALRCVRVKAAIVGRDEREAGERAVLNFGHTLGHALEADGGFEALTHGEAVSLGVVAALRVGVRRGVTEAALADRVTRLLAGLGLPTALAPAQVGRAVRLIELDKKRVGRQIRAILMRAPGDVELTPIDVDELTRGFVDAANFAPAPARPLD